MITKQVWDSVIFKNCYFWTWLYTLAGILQIAQLFFIWFNTLLHNLNTVQ